MQVCFGHEALTLKTQEIFCPSGKVWKWYPIKWVRNNIDLIAPTHLELCIFSHIYVREILSLKVWRFFTGKFCSETKWWKLHPCATVQGWLEPLNVVWCELKVMCGSLLLPMSSYISGEHRLLLWLTCVWLNAAWKQRLSFSMLIALPSLNHQSGRHFLASKSSGRPCFSIGDLRHETLKRGNPDKTELVITKGRKLYFERLCIWYLSLSFFCSMNHVWFILSFIRQMKISVYSVFLSEVTSQLHPTVGWRYTENEIELDSLKNEH